MINAKEIFSDEKDRKLIKSCLDIFNGTIIKIVDKSS